MDYIYIPDTYNCNLIRSNFRSVEEFVNLQVFYRHTLEKIISSFIDFLELDNYILSYDIKLPVINDKNYNFYHKYSSFNSKYIYLRNNFHIENLSSTELEILRDGSSVNSDFIYKTISKVIFETGDEACFGSIIEENFVKAKSLVFEFSFDQKLCTSIKDFSLINDVIIKNVFGIIGEKIKNNLKLDVSFVKYYAIPDLFYLEEKKVADYFE